MTLELTGLKKVRKLIFEEADKPNSPRRTGLIVGMVDATEQFQSDLRAIEAGLREALAYRYGDYPDITAIISAIHSAIEESEK